MAKRPPLDLSSMSTCDVRVGGVNVTVRVDANGWPISASAGGWIGAESERLAILAITLVRDRAQRAVEAQVKAGSDAKRTKKSTETKQARAAKHFSGKWLAAALRRDPKRGAGRLAFAARRLLGDKPDDPDYERRAEITEYRAKEFLKVLKNSGDM